MIFLYLVNDTLFNVLEGSQYFGRIVKHGDFWTLLPEQRIKDIDEKTLIEIDRILGILND